MVMPKITSCVTNNRFTITLCHHVMPHKFRTTEIMLNGGTLTPINIKNIYTNQRAHNTVQKHETFVTTIVPGHCNDAFNCLCKGNPCRALTERKKTQ